MGGTVWCTGSWTTPSKWRSAVGITTNENHAGNQMTATLWLLMILKRFRILNGDLHFGA
jgi:hypothetical protein